MISNEALKSFIAIWENEFGEVISEENALEEATNLIVLFSTIYRPLQYEELFPLTTDRINEL